MIELKMSVVIVKMKMVIGWVIEKLMIFNVDYWSLMCCLEGF